MTARKTPEQKARATWLAAAGSIVSFWLGAELRAESEAVIVEVPAWVSV